MCVKRISFSVLVLSALLVVVATAVPASAELLDEVADLDLNNVVKAINFGVTTDQTIGTTTFLAADAGTTVDGVTNDGLGGASLGAWTMTIPVIGDTADDDALEEILGTLVYGSPLEIDVSVPNGTYTMQLLLYEGWGHLDAGAARAIDVTDDAGVLIADDYNLWIEQGSIPDYGTVIGSTFDVTDENIDISFTVNADNVIVAGLIINQIPEPSTFVLAVFGLVGSAFYGLRRRNR